MLIRTRPFNPVLDRRVDRAFDQLTSSLLATTRRTPVIDAAWDDGSLVLTVDLPGTPADAVDVAVAGRTLSISVNTGDHSWERSFRLNAALDPEQVTAAHVDGRLTVTVGAAASAERRRIEITTTPAPAVPVASQTEDATSDNG